MKARNRLERRSTFVSRSRDLPGQDRILQQIEIITGELDVLQAEIHRRMAEPARDSARRSPTEEAAAAYTMAHFKAALDRLRHVLWFYIEQLANSQQMDAHRKPLRQDQGGPADLHRAVTPPSGEAESDPPGSFFDRLNVVIDSCMKAQRPQSNPRRRGK